MASSGPAGSKTRVSVVCFLVCCLVDLGIVVGLVERIKSCLLMQGKPPSLHPANPLFGTILAPANWQLHFRLEADSHRQDSTKIHPIQSLPADSLNGAGLYNLYSHPIAYRVPHYELDISPCGLEGAQLAVRVGHHHCHSHSLWRRSTVWWWF